MRDKTVYDLFHKAIDHIVRMRRTTLNEVLLPTQQR